MMEADGIIFGSPVYCANISSNMQAFLERAAVVGDMNRGLLSNRHKVGASVAAVRRGGALQAIDAMNHFFLTFVPFCISHSSGIGTSDTNLHSLAGNAEWIDGQRFSADTSREEVRAWLDSLGFISETASQVGVFNFETHITD